jgi:YihY family inner membrane protein
VPAAKTKAKAKSTAKRKTRGFVERLPDPLQRLVELFRSEDLFLTASGLAFYALISVVPLTVVALWVATVLFGDGQVQQMSKQLERVAPKELATALETVASRGASLGGPAILAALWPASSYGAGLVRGFDRVSPSGGQTLKGLRGRALAVLVILPVLVVGGLLGTLVGTGLVSDGVLGRIAGAVIGLAVGFAFAAVGLLLVYRIFPPERLPWRAVGRATLFAGVGIAVLSLAFSVYLSFATGLEQHYVSGAVAGLVLLGVWLLLVNAILLAGYRLVSDR